MVSGEGSGGKLYMLAAGEMQKWWESTCTRFFCDESLLEFLHHAGGGDEAADVASLMGRQDAATSHHQTQALVDWQAAVHTHHTWQRQPDPNPLHPS